MNKPPTIPLPDIAIYEYGKASAGSNISLGSNSRISVSLIRSKLPIIPLQHNEKYGLDSVLGLSKELTGSGSSLALNPLVLLDFQYIEAPKVKIPDLPDNLNCELIYEIPVANKAEVSVVDRESDKIGIKSIMAPPVKVLPKLPAYLPAFSIGSNKANNHEETLFDLSSIANLASASDTDITDNLNPLLARKLTYFQRKSGLDNTNSKESECDSLYFGDAAIDMELTPDLSPSTLESRKRVLTTKCTEGITLESTQALSKELTQTLIVDPQVNLKPALDLKIINSNFDSPILRGESKAMHSSKSVNIESSAGTEEQRGLSKSKSGIMKSFKKKPSGPLGKQKNSSSPSNSSPDLRNVLDSDPKLRPAIFNAAEFDNSMVVEQSSITGALSVPNITSHNAQKRKPAGGVSVMLPIMAQRVESSNKNIQSAQSEASAVDTLAFQKNLLDHNGSSGNISKAKGEFEKDVRLKSDEKNQPKNALLELRSLTEKRPATKSDKLGVSSMKNSYSNFDLESAEPSNEVISDTKNCLEKYQSQNEMHLHISNASPRIEDNKVSVPASQDQLARNKTETRGKLFEMDIMNSDDSSKDITRSDNFKKIAECKPTSPSKLKKKPAGAVDVMMMTSLPHLNSFNSRKNFNNSTAELNVLSTSVNKPEIDRKSTQLSPSSSTRHLGAVDLMLVDYKPSLNSDILDGSLNFNFEPLELSSFTTESRPESVLIISPSSSKKQVISPRSQRVPTTSKNLIVNLYFRDPVESSSKDIMRGGTKSKEEISAGSRDHIPSSPDSRYWCKFIPVTDKMQIVFIPLNSMFDIFSYSLEPNFSLRVGRNNDGNHQHFIALSTLVISRNHLDIRLKDKKVYIVDLGSSSGTFRNNNRLCQVGEVSPNVEILTGDYIQLGKDYIIDRANPTSPIDCMQYLNIDKKRCVIFQVVLVRPDQDALREIQSQG